MADRGSGETTTFSPIFCPVYSRLSPSTFPLFPLLSEKSKLLLPPGRYYQDSSRLWHVPNRRILHGGLISPCFDLCFHFLRTLSFSLSRSLVSSYSGPFRFIFYSLTFYYYLTHFSFSFFLSCKEFIYHQSSSSALPITLFSHLIPFFLITEARRNLVTLILQPLNAVSRKPEKMALRGFT